MRNDVLDLRPLSPMQEGMLYHALREPDSPAYIEQASFRIRGPLDAGRLERAWNSLIARHDALRTVFVPAKASRPLQMVLRERQLAFQHTADSSPFDLTRDLLLRVALIPLGREDTRMVWTHHHIILDGWSAAILMGELLSIYEGAFLQPPQPPASYSEWLSKQDTAAARKWWASVLADYEDPASLPGDPLAAGKGELQVIELEMDLRDCAARANVTLNTLIQCAWGVLLARACNRQDVVFGMTVSGRPSALPGAEHMVGLFINTVPVRVRFQETDTVAALLARVQEQILAGEPYHFLPLAEIQDVSAPRSRLIDHLLTFENYPVGDALRGVAGLDIAHEASHERTNYPLAIAIAPGERLLFSIRYVDSVYSPPQMERLTDALRTLLQSFTPDAAIRDLKLVSPQAHAELESFQGPGVEVPNENITSLFERQVRLYPNRVALVDDAVELTYGELNTRVDALARTMNLRPGEALSIGVEPCADLIVQMLAILKAGGAYVPTWDMAPALSGEGLAYILFTSGSTGEPKPVAIEHRSVVNLVCAGIAPMWAPLGAPLRVALIAPPVFDASVQQIFGALLLGHTLVVPSHAVKRDPHRLLDWLEEQQIDVCDGTPSRFALLMEAGLHERPRMPVLHWMLGGEALPTAMLREYWADGRHRRVTVSNLYGPTECCVDNTAALITADSLDRPATAPIGKPLGNQQVFVLDRNLHEVPVLFEGEFCIAGPGVGRGLGPLYRTGDIGRWLPDGRLEWLGRADGQIKVRGYRVETGEIEQVMRSHPAIGHAAAGLVGRELAAWYTASTDVDLREWLRTRLPEYKVPAFFTRVETMPFTASGKLDRRRLPAPAATVAVDEHEPNAAERAVRSIWEEVLNRRSIGLRQEFFEAGGHSLKAMQVVARIRKDLGVTIGIEEFFANPTIEGIAALLADRNAERFLHIDPLPPADDYATSHAQRRLWFLSQLEGADAYDMPAAIQIDGALDVAALRLAFAAVIDRHEILRSRLVMRDGELRQVVDQNNLQHEILPNGNNSHVLRVNLHHAFGDGLSMAVLWRDLLAAYSGVALEPLRIQYRDYAAWSLQAPAQRHRRYWHEKLSGQIATLDLPADRPRPPQPSFRGGKVRFSIPAGLHELAAKEKTTLFVGFVAAVKALLHRYTGEAGIVIGTPVSGRPHPELEQQIGCYINTVALRDTVSGSDSFLTLLRNVRKTVAEALEHQSYPFDLLVNELPLARDTSRNPLFNVMVILQPPAAELPTPPGLKITPLVLDRGVSKFDLTFEFAESDVTLEYSSDLFDRARIERLAGHFSTLVESAVGAPETPIGKLAILSRGDEGAWGMAPALPVRPVWQSQGWSHALLRRGDVVGIYLRRSEWLSISELAVLRAGAVFLPLSPSMPEERLRFMVNDSGMRALISDAAELPEWAASFPVIDPRAAIESDDPLPAPQPDDLAYLIYTSGSTGTPKGVSVPHRALLSFAANLTHTFGFRPGETMYAATPATFDISILELVCAPLNGIKVQVASDEAMEDPALMAREIERCGSTLLQFTPSRLEQLLAEKDAHFLQQARVLLVGGEAFPAPLARRLRQFTNLEVWNVYGPTETCIWSTAERLGPGDDAPLIGRPLPGESVYILSPDLELQPIGVPGEIAIGGSGLAHGYHNNPELTSRRFVHVPFAPGRVYLTGDLGRLNDAGRLEYLGRKDHQIKLRGYRIELGEIEQHLRAHPAVKAATVVLRDAELVAYVVADGPLDFREHLRRTLPDYMIPSHCVFLDALPLNQSGKIDRRALPAPDSTAPREWEAPQTAMEWRIASVFEEVLGCGPVGRTGQFFDLGGQSLKAMQALSRLRRDVAAGLKLADLFSAPTVAALAELATSRASALLPPIPKAESGQSYPLSNAQRRLWVLEQMNPETSAYSMPAAFVLEGHIDLRALERTVHALVDRHEILRTVFALEAGEPKQFIRDTPLCFRTIDLRTLPDRESRVEALLTADAREPFDLARGPLFRCTAYLLEHSRAILGLRMHHIVSDGWSMRVMLQDLLALYQGHDLTPLEIQYRDYAGWQRTLDRQREYWHRQLAGPLPVLDFPEDSPRPAVQSFRGAEHRWLIDSETADGLRKVARESGASLFMTLLAAVKALLHRYTGNEDIIVGTPVAGREHPALEPLVGVFVNSLALRDTVEGDMRFRDLLDLVRDTVIDGLENQAYPFDLLVDELIRDRDTSRSAFFDVMVSVGAEDPLDLSAGGITARAITRPTGIARFDLSFDFTESQGGGIEVAVEYNRDIFVPARIGRMQTHMETLFRSIVANPEQRVGMLELMPATERELVIHGFNQSAAEFNRAMTVIDMFEEQVRLDPQALATTCEGRSWTYGELNTRADQIAAKMVAERRIGSGDFVAVYTRRSDWMIASILAVGKAGAAYVPVDPSYPAERVALLLGSSGCRLMLSEPDTAAFSCGIENWDVAAISGGQVGNLSCGAPTDLAYVIFTSGSTGSPKGVMVEHLSLANLASHYIRTLGLTRADRSSIFASMAFDASVAECWSLLCARGSLHFPSTDIRESPKALIEWIASTGLTILNMPTALGEMILRGPLPSGLRLRTVIVGGEKLRPLPRRDYPFQIVNSYGPTEATVDACWAWLTPDEYSAPNPPIGSAVQNARLYVLDRFLNPVPVGVAGELYIGGTVVASGYLNQPELTASKFVRDPIAGGDTRMYATGDRVRWREDGRLEYFGRTDRQIKVRGYRIEPGEIEARLLEHPAVSAAAVDAIAVGESQELVAWIVIREGIPQPDWLEIRDFVRAALPEFMTPALVVFVDAIPLTPNGKINRAALPAPLLDSRTASEIVAPRTAVESVIYAAWRAILGRSDFGVLDNFFDLGGHSLKAMQLTVRLLNSLNVEIPLREIFLAPTVAAQAILAAVKQRAQARQIESAPALPDYPLSRAQRRLWLTTQMEAPGSRYHMPGAYVIDDMVDESALARAIHTLLERHEAVRTRFVVRDGEPRQVVDPVPEIELPRIDLRDASGPEARARELAEADLRQPFDLARDRLFRCRLLRLAPARYVLLFTLHHIAGDGWSMQILYEELRELYSAFALGAEPALPPLRLQYKDYAWWERETGFAAEESYWLGRFRSVPDPIRLPFDFAERDEYEFTGAAEGLQLSREVSDHLRRLGAERGTTLSNVLLTVFFVFLNRLTEQSDLALAMSVANRPHRDLETMAGFFVNAVVLRAWVDEEKPFETLLDEVTTEVAGALEHQQYPLDLLIEKLNPPRRGNRQPLFNVVYAFQGFTDVSIRSGRASGFEISGELDAVSRTSKFDLTLFVVDQQGVIHLSFEYSTELLQAETVRHWLEILGRFCAAATAQQEVAHA